jgi:hypothetical protein
MRPIVIATRVGALLWMRATWVALAALGVWACGEREPSSAPRSEPSRTPGGGGAGYREVDVALGGSLYGRVTWVGERPPTVRASLGTGCAADEALPLLTVGPRGGVANAVVVLTGVSEGRPMSPSSTELTFSECRLSPHLIAVPRGTVLRFASSDPFLHNAHAVDAGGTSRFDVAVLPGGESAASLRLDEAGILLVRDDAGHPGTHAWIHVVDHPYFAVTEPGGAFRIEDVPVGRYTLMVWHEGVTSAGVDASGRPIVSPPIVLSRGVTVVSGQDTPADFQLDLRLAADAAADGTVGGR